MALKRYPEEFRADAVALFLSDLSHTYKQIAADLGISRGTFAQLGTGDPAARDGAGPGRTRAAGAEVHAQSARLES